MRVALVNPDWNQLGGVTCNDPHLPLALGFARALLEADGHETLLVDVALEGISLPELYRRVEGFAPELTVVATEPSILHSSSDLRVPQQVLAALTGVGGIKIVVGSELAALPAAALNTLDADVAVLDECEEILVRLASTPREQWNGLASVAVRGDEGVVHVNAGPHVTDLDRLPPLTWPHELLARHHHHHHRWGGQATGLGAEVEASRGARDGYRRRPLDRVLKEIDGLVARGVEYVYFVDEIFLPNRELLEALEARPIEFGVRTRIDPWSFDMIDLLGKAGCVSLDATVGSVDDETRSLLIRAKRFIPYVQATLRDGRLGDPEAIASWRASLSAQGVWTIAPEPSNPEGIPSLIGAPRAGTRELLTG